MAKLWKPNKDEIIELQTATENIYNEGGTSNQWDLDDQIYECKIEEFLGIPKEFASEAVALPTARDFIDTAVDHTNVFNPIVKVPSKSPAKIPDDDAEMMRKFYLGVLYRNNVEQSIAPARVACKHLYIYGLGILKTIFDGDRYIDKPERNEDEDENTYSNRIDEWRATYHDMMPIVIQAIHPSNVMFDRYHDTPEFVFETRETLVFNMKNKYPNWSNPKGKPVTGKVKHVSFWTKDYRCELFDDEPVLRTPITKHSYGFIPYVPIDSGMGNISKDNDLCKRYVGLLRYCRGLIISESRNYSNGDIVMKRGVYPQFVLKGDNAALAGKIDQHYGTQVTLPDGVDLVPLSQMVIPQEAIQWMSITSSLLDSRAPRALRGLSESGVRSGSHQRSLADQAGAMYQYSNEAFRNASAKVLINCARIQKYVIKSNIHVWARTPIDEIDAEIDASKMKEPFTVYVTYNTQSEEENYRKHDDLERLVKNLGLPPSWAYNQMENVDTKAVERKVLVDQVKQGLLPVLIQSLGAELTAALQQEQLPPPVVPGQGQPQPGGVVNPQDSIIANRQAVPPTPNRAQPGSAQDLQNQLTNIRSNVSVTQQGMGGGGNRP